MTAGSGPVENATHGLPDERLAEIRAEDARYSVHPYGEEILASWRDGLTRHQMSGERAIIDRRELLAEVDRLRGRANTAEKELADVFAQIQRAREYAEQHPGFVDPGHLELAFEGVENAQARLMKETGS